LQRIENDIVGPEVKACELYPAESWMVDTANQYHLWCLPPGQSFPFGFDRRLVLNGDLPNARQRPFDDPELQREAEATEQRIRR
jgi:hypothetical protein